jgi:hypothetical protein
MPVFEAIRSGHCIAVARVINDELMYVGSSVRELCAAGKPPGRKRKEDEPER